MNWRLLIYGGIALSLLLSGWKAHSWYADSQALSDYERALNATQAAYQEALSEQAALYQAEIQKSLTLEQQNQALRESVAGLREEIDHVTFTPPVVDSCRSHPVDSPEFGVYYDRAARGDSEARESDPGRVSPRDD